MTSQKHKVWQCGFLCSKSHSQRQASEKALLPEASNVRKGRQGREHSERVSAPRDQQQDMERSALRDGMEADLELTLLEGRPKGQGSRRPREKGLET